MATNFQNTAGSPMNEIKKFLFRKDVFSGIIMVNIAVWVLISTAKVFLLFAGKPVILAEVFSNLYLGGPSSFNLLLHVPWTILTYMFVHYDLFHILFNLLWFYWMGKIFLEYIDKNQLLPLYFAGGIGGYLLFALAYNYVPALGATAGDARVIGASASVMAIVSAIAFYVPNYTMQLMFIGRVKLIYLAIGLFVLDFLMIGNTNAGGHIAHLGGALAGYLYYRAYKKGFRFMGFNRIILLFQPKKLKVTGKPINRMNDEDYSIHRAQHQQEIDKILEKISKSGYQSLNSLEKELLFRESRKSQ
ncbi:MAG: rhomboid family intramembrane serine protease [Bacteroidales bacterium]|nr:rhomboid family intramembrane serine protease [Bacteroidales bacterium]